MKLVDLFKKDYKSKRQETIQETGIDPRTVNKFFPNSGVTHTRLELTDKTRTRGGKNSRRRTARVWEPASTDAD